jgi:hypothetical protein
MVQRYAHLRPDHLQAAVERLVGPGALRAASGATEAPAPGETNPQLARDRQTAPAMSRKWWYARQGSNLRPTDSKAMPPTLPPDAIGRYRRLFGILRSALQGMGTGPDQWSPMGQGKSWPSQGAAYAPSSIPHGCRPLLHRDPSPGTTGERAPPATAVGHPEVRLLGAVQVHK